MATDVPLLLVASHARANSTKSVLELGGFHVHLHQATGPGANDPLQWQAWVVDTGDRDKSAWEFMTRWRSRAQLVPVLWLCSADEREAGFDLGADTCLARPYSDGDLLAAIRSLQRRAAAVQRLGNNNAELARVNDTLRDLYLHTQQDRDLARRVHWNGRLTRFPEVGATRFALAHRPQATGGGDCFHLCAIDDQNVGFFVGNVTGRAPTADLLATFLRQHLESMTRTITVDHWLATLAEELQALEAPDQPIVRLTLGWVNAVTGEVAFGGRTSVRPVRLPADGPPEACTLTTQFSASDESVYSTGKLQLGPGDRILMYTDGLSQQGPSTMSRLLDVAPRHRDRFLQPFVEFVVSEALAVADEPDDFTLLAIEYR